MRRTERMRQAASGQVTWDEIQRFQREGWRLTSLEWERDLTEDESVPSRERDHEDPPFGLRVAADSRRRAASLSCWSMTTMCSRRITWNKCLLYLLHTCAWAHWVENRCPSFLLNHRHGCRNFFTSWLFVI